MKWPVLFLFLPAATMHEWLWPGPLVRTVFLVWGPAGPLARWGCSRSSSAGPFLSQLLFSIGKSVSALPTEMGRNSATGWLKSMTVSPLVTFFVPSTGKPCATGRRWGRLDCCPQGAFRSALVSLDCLTNCHKLRGLQYNLYDLTEAGQSLMGASTRLTLEVLAGPCSFLETWGKNPFPAHAWCCWQNSVSFFFLFWLRYNWHTIASKFKVYGVLTRSTYVFQCDDHHSLELNSSCHIIGLFFFVVRTFRIYFQHFSSIQYGIVHNTILH